jgi:transposase
MLTMEQIYHIKYLHNQKGKSYRKIAEETGHNFETVKKYVERNDFNLESKPTKRRRSKLEPYKELIDSWLESDLKSKPKQRHTAQRIYNRLKEMYREEFKVSDRAIREYVSRRKKEIGLNTEGYLPLEHPPGEAQVDFGEAQFIEKGILYDGYYLNLSFPYSNAGMLQVFKGQNQECLLEGLKDIFNFTGGCPTAIWFDNMSTVVNEIRKQGKRDINKGFLRFIMHYGFASNFCNPNSGHEKGHVENKVGYHRRNFLVPIPEFEDIRKYNRELLQRCQIDMNRDHYKRAASIAQLFEEDRQAMQSLPRIPFEVCRLEAVKADNYAKVRYENQRYSSAPDYAGKQLWLKIGAHQIELLDREYQQIISHERLYGQPKESMKWIPYLELMARRPTALRYSSFIKELPATIQQYFDQCEYEAKKAALKVLSRMVNHTDVETASQAFETAISKGTTDIDSIWATYVQQTSGIPEAEAINLPTTVPELKEYHPDTSVYDTLLRGGTPKWKQ